MTTSPTDITLSRPTAHALQHLARAATNTKARYATEALHYAITLLTRHELTHGIIQSLIEDVKNPPVYGLTYETQLRRQIDYWDAKAGRTYPLVWRHAAHCPTSTDPSELIYCAEQHRDGYGEDCQLADDYHDVTPIEGVTGRYRIYAVYADSDTAVAQATFTPGFAPRDINRIVDIFPPRFSHLRGDDHDL